MTSSQKLKILIAVLFVLIVVMIGMLIYAVNVYNNEDRSASNTATETSAASTTDEAATTSQQSDSTADEKETIDLKLYVYDAQNYDEPAEVRTVTVDKKLYQEDLTAALNQLLSQVNLKINKVVVNGSLITVDLSKETALKFNSGSAGGITLTNILAMTMLNLPGTDKLEVTVDGAAGIEGDHFNFNGTFSKAEDGKKYILTDSGREGKALDY